MRVTTPSIAETICCPALSKRSTSARSKEISTSSSSSPALDEPCLGSGLQGAGKAWCCCWPTPVSGPPGVCRWSRKAKDRTTLISTGRPVRTSTTVAADIRRRTRSLCSTWLSGVPRHCSPTSSPQLSQATSWSWLPNTQNQQQFTTELEPGRFTIARPGCQSRPHARCLEEGHRSRTGTARQGSSRCGRFASRG